MFTHGVNVCATYDNLKKLTAIEKVAGQQVTERAKCMHFDEMLSDYIILLCDESG